MSPVVGEAGNGVGMVHINTNGATRPTGVLNAKAGSGAVRPRPVKKQRMVSSSGSALLVCVYEVPLARRVCC